LCAARTSLPAAAPSTRPLKSNRLRPWRIPRLGAVLLVFLLGWAVGSGPLSTEGHGFVAGGELRAPVGSGATEVTEAGARDNQEWIERRRRIDQEFDKQLRDLADKCEDLGLVEEARTTRQWQFERDPRRQYIFLPSAGELSPPMKPPGRESTKDPDAEQGSLQDKWQRKFLELRGVQAESLWQLALDHALAGDGAHAYRLLFEILRHAPDHRQARRVLGFERGPKGWRTRRDEPRLAQPNVPHALLGWQKRSYWKYETEHFSIVTNKDAAAARQLGDRLESLHVVWRQLFFPIWASNTALQARMQGRDDRLGPDRRHDVVLFSTRDEFVARLGKGRPQIDRALGIYLDKERVAFFHVGEPLTNGTWSHEATHQLFQETNDAPLDVGKLHGAWAVEAVALYMESLIIRPEYATVGGIDADRLQFPRYRTLRGVPGASLERLASMTRDDLQQDPEISVLYGAAAGWAHFFMDAESGRYRNSFTRYLGELYAGRADHRSLKESLRVEFDELERQYRRFLDLTDDDWRRTEFAPVLQKLAMGRTQLTDAACRQLQAFSALEWADLAFLPVSDDGLRNLQRAAGLKQLFLERTLITDDGLAALAGLEMLEELDLSDCKISDRGLQHLAGLKRLKKLYLTNCSITDTGLRQLRSLKKLDTLELTGTQVTPGGIEELKQALPLWK